MWGAIACLSASERAAAIGVITPLVRMSTIWAGVWLASVALLGALPPSWQILQRASNRAAPSGAGWAVAPWAAARARAAPAREAARINDFIIFSLEQCAPR